MPMNYIKPERKVRKNQQKLRPATELKNIFYSVPTNKRSRRTMVGPKQMYKSYNTSTNIVRG